MNGGSCCFMYGGGFDGGGTVRRLLRTNMITPTKTTMPIPTGIIGKLEDDCSAGVGLGIVGYGVMSGVVVSSGVIVSVISGVVVSIDVPTGGRRGVNEIT